MTPLALFFAACRDHRPSRREREARALHALGHALIGETLRWTWTS